MPFHERGGEGTSDAVVATAVEIVPAPDPQERHIVRLITLYNTGASAVVELRKKKGSTTCQLRKATVATDGDITYPPSGVIVLDEPDESIELVVDLGGSVVDWTVSYGVAS